MGFIKCIIEKSIDIQLIDADLLEWYVYGITKRFLEFFTWTIILLFGTLYFGFCQTIAFGGAFCFIRKFTNGYHASTWYYCLLISLSLEFAGLCLASHLLFFHSLILLIFSDIIIIFLSPCNNLYMHFSDDELHALRPKILFRLAILNSIYLLVITSYPIFSYSIVTALSADAILLLIAHVTY